ncbi:MAG: hypothetical protein MHPSP_001820, partial [Paramarteilia canceri]
IFSICSAFIIFGFSEIVESSYVNENTLSQRVAVRVTKLSSGRAIDHFDGIMVSKNTVIIMTEDPEKKLLM